MDDTLEFDIVKFVNETLKPMPIPVYFLAKKEIEPPMVLFNVNGEKGSMFYDNEEQEIVYKVMVNIFSKGNFIEYKKQIMKLMKQAGFIRTDVPACIYLEDVELYNQPMNFKFYKEI